MFLEEQLCKDFAKALDSSPIFLGSEDYNDSLLFAVHDRIQSCVEFLNNHDEIPTSEPDFILFLVYCCMVKDALTQLFDYLKIEYPFKSCESAESRKYFLDICTAEPIDLTESEYKNDDKFFEYFRSLAFAHPFETSRHKWIQKGATQYSPWVIGYRRYLAFSDSAYKVGVKVYSDKYPEDDENHGIKSIEIRFELLKDYIVSRYNLLQKATEWVYSEVERVKNEWQKTKVKRDLPIIGILKDISNILVSRSEEVYDVSILIKDMSLELSISENLSSVNLYRQAIIDLVPELCDDVDNIRHEEFSEKTSHIISAHPNKAHEWMGYQLEKIFCYLTDYNVGCENHSWGLQQAEFFSKEFAKKYVTIKPYEMSHDEIHLLVRTACYLEYQSQRQKAKVNV
jgi:hypothetical protein